ncbi:6-bladed beta-propeller [Rhodohalobacter sp. 8-1]|uniref:6-bladed beta-propeller n=1 Tax=Rhodohalobacter sp. 8-1 TaxID=3131972 RepID=UPI0030EB2E0A
MTFDQFIKSEFEFISSFGPVFLTFVALLFSISFGAETSFAQELSVDFHEKKSITEDPDNFFLSALISVNVDNDFNMYLSDYSQNVVLKVDSTGNYIDTIVKNGSGPGEVNSIYSVMVDKRLSNVIIADRLNARISKLDLNGNEMQAITINPSENNIPVAMTKFTDGNYLFLFSLSPKQNLRSIKGIDTFFHIYNLDAGERTQSFGDRENLLDSLSYSNGIAAAFTSSRIGSVKLLSDDQLLYAPYVYGGTMLKHRKDDEGDWKLSRKVTGNSLSRQVAIDFNFEDYLDNRKAYRDKTPRNISTSMGEGKNAAGIINYYSGGIYQTSDYIMHFYISEDEFEDTFRHTLHVELFDDELNFLSSHTLYEGQVGEILAGGVTDMDSEGNFYMPVRHLSQPEKNRAMVFKLEITE